MNIPATFQNSFDNAVLCKVVKDDELKILETPRSAHCGMTKKDCNAWIVIDYDIPVVAKFTETCQTNFQNTK